MTESELRHQYVNTAIGFLGAREYSNRHKEIIALYNAQKPLPRGIPMELSYDWCAAFVTAIAVRCQMTSIIACECSCNLQIKEYKRWKRWIEEDSYKPSMGDIVYYDWEDSGWGDNQGEADHVGIVVSVTGNAIKVIEGNRGNAVAYRTISVNSRYIRGYAIPDYASLADKKTVIESDRVKYTKKLQQALNTSYQCGLEVDGSCGPLTQAAIHRHYLRYKNPVIQNTHVSWLQEMLRRLGYTLEVDGSCGPITGSTIRQFQQKYGLEVDGYAGKATHLKILSLV